MRRRKNRRKTSFRELCRAVLALGRAAANRFRSTHLSLYAAQASYYVLFSSIPFCALLFMAAKGLFPAQFDGLLTAIRGLFPEFSNRLPAVFWETVLSVSVPALSIAILSLLWAASKGLKAIAAGLCAIYGAPPGKNPLVRLLWSVLYTVVLMLILLFSLFLLVLGGNLFPLLQKNLPGWAAFLQTLLNFRGLISIAVFSASFTLLYKFLAARRWPFRRLLPGAVFAGSGWILFSYGFSLYLRYFSGYSTLYGALGALMILMIWIHSCMLLLLLGAELNVFLYGSSRTA